MPIAEDAPSNDLSGIATTLSDNVTKRRSAEIVEVALDDVIHILSKATNVPRPLTDEEIADHEKQEKVQLSAGSGTKLVLTNWTFTNLQGRIYSNVTFSTMTPINITVALNPYLYAQIDFTNLPENIREHFHYDPAKAATFVAEQAAVRARIAKDARIRREFNDQKSRILATEWRVSAKILQIVKDGVLVNINAASEPTMLWQYPSAGLVDGQYLSVTVYPIGTYQYETVMHSSKTIPRLTTDLMLAIRMDFWDKHPHWPLDQVKPGMTPDQIQELQREQKLEAQLRGIDYVSMTNDAP